MKKLLLLVIIVLFGANVNAQTNLVTFQVHNPDSTPVFVFGSWSGWSNWPGDPMANVGNGYYSVTLSIPNNTTHEFLFVNGVGPTKEALDPAWPCTNGNGQYTNRVFTLGVNDTTVCADWQSCNTCAVPTGTVAVTFQVHNSDSTPVFVFGSWSGWSNWPGDLMQSVGNGYYAKTLFLPSSTTYEYLYVNGVGPSKEILDPAWPCTNGNGQYTNRTLQLAAIDTTVCNDWQSCNSCFVQSTTRYATIRVESPDSLPVYVFGNWNNWSNWPGEQMTSIGNNLYEATIQLNSNGAYEYLFVNGVGPTKEVLDPSWPCTNGNGQYTNRTLTMGTNDTTVCAIWELCNLCTTSSINNLASKQIRYVINQNGIQFLGDDYAVSTIEIFDLLGRSIFKQVQSNSNKFNVDLKLNQTYFLRVEIDGVSSTIKAIITE